MSLENDIKQKEFKSEYQKAVVNLIYTYNHTVDRISSVFKKYDITRQQYNVLRILRGQHPKPTNINLIKERMLDKMSDASRIVERLRIKELLEREQCQQDKRSVEIKISDAGLQLLEQVDPHLLEFESNYIQLSEEEAQTLNHLLDKLRGSNEQ